MLILIIHHVVYCSYLRSTTQNVPQTTQAHALYLSPLKAPKGDIWYPRSPIGHNTLAKTIPRLMNNAGIVGNFTNHSLWSTSTTRLFNAHVDE